MASTSNSSPNVAKSDFKSGTLGPIRYATKAVGSLPPTKSIEQINKANSPEAHKRASGVIGDREASRGPAGAET